MYRLHTGKIKIVKKNLKTLCGVCINEYFIYNLQLTKSI